MRATTGLLAASLGLAATAGAAVATSGVLTALGGRPDPEVLRSSPQYRDGTFHNARPARWLPRGSTGDAVRSMLFSPGTRRPAGAVPLVGPSPDPPDRGEELHVTWYGHASSLVEFGETRVLLDPVWSDRVSPARFAGPRRLHPVPHRLADLPRLDAIVISHDHYDHLDLNTVLELTRLQAAPFVVPLGVGAHLRAWDVPDERIVELDWHRRATFGPLTITATPAQHFSGRGFTRNPTLWASWVLTSPHGRVFYSGDTGYCDAFADIGRDHGPFDLTLVQVGAYAPSWPDIHMTPEEGVATHRDVRGELLVPVHWGTFTLAPHAWAEPVERLLSAAAQHDVRVAVPRPGERLAVKAGPAARSPEHWWRSLARF